MICTKIAFSIIYCMKIKKKRAKTSTLLQVLFKITRNVEIFFFFLKCTLMNDTLKTVEEHFMTYQIP